MPVLDLFKRKKKDTSLAKSGRSSYATVRQRFQSWFGYLKPNESGKWKYGEITASTLKKGVVSEILGILIENSDVLSLSVGVHKQKIVQGVDLVSPEDDRDAIQIIEDFYARMAEMGIDKIGLLSDFAYSMVVEGGLCAELIFSEDGSDPIEIGLISPLSLIFPDKRSEVYGPYNQVAQLQADGKWKVLHDKYDPEAAEVESDCFVYTPVNVIDHKPHGSSDLSPAIFSTLAIKEFMDLLTQYSRIQIFQRGVLSPDLSEYINSDKYDDTDAIRDYSEQKVNDLKKEFDASDVTQILFSDIKVEFTPIGNQTRANMDGAEIVVRLLERAQGRGAKLPRVIYNPDRSGSSLGEAESQTEWQIFQQRLAYFRGVMEVAFNKFHTTILRHYGNMSHVEMKLDDTDYEGMLLFASVIKTAVETYTQAITEGRFLTRQEGRHLLLQHGSLFKDIEPELPPELQNDPNPQPEPTE